MQERLQLRTAYSALPAFCLDINFFQSELIKRNYPINSAISASTNTLQIVSASPVAKAVQHVENNDFKAVGADL